MRNPGGPGILMQPAIKLFGIPFRSRKHADWCSGTILCTVFTGYLTASAFLQGEPFALVTMGAVMGMCATFLAMMSTAALYITSKRGDGELWSRDCIWYNAALSLAHAGFSILLIVRLLQG